MSQGVRLAAVGQRRPQPIGVVLEAPLTVASTLNGGSHMTRVSIGTSRSAASAASAAPDDSPTTLAGAAGCGEQHVEVLDLTFEGERKGVRAVATTSAVVVEHREMRGERSREGCIDRTVNRGARYEDQRWTSTELIEGNRRAVC